MKRLNAILIGLSAATLAWAEPAAPDAVIRQVTQEVLDSLARAGDGTAPRRTTEYVIATVLPKFDFPRMTALALGRDWRQATPAQQAELTEEFQKLLVRTYSNALTAYRGQTVDVKPARVGGGDGEVTVHTELRQRGAAPVPVDYAMSRKDDGWLVHDVTVGGISLVTAYRDQFGQEIRNGGIDGLIRTLRAKNAGGVAARS